MRSAGTGRRWTRRWPDEVGTTRATLAEKSRYEQSFTQCQNLWEDSPDVRPLSFHPRIAGTAARLLGVDVVRLWHDQALYKEPGGRETDPHQDQPYWPIVETDTITAWIPFDGSTLEGGAMGYLPGSHLLGVREFVNIFFGEPEDVLGRTELAGIEPVWVEVPAGAVAYHHGLTFHLARPERHRYRPSGAYGDLLRRRFDPGWGRFPHPSVERAGIPLGGVIASDVTPVAWPLTGGVLPPAPAEPIGTVQ